MDFISELAYKILKVYRLPKQLILKKRLGECGKEVVISTPCRMSQANHIFIKDYVLIQPNCTFIMNKGKIFIGKWCTISSNCTFITDNHRPTVGINTRMLNKCFINDEIKDIIIEDDCWCGAGVTLLNGVKMGRGSIAAAGALVNKTVPPYAVVAGVPAKIIATVFSIEQILEHEKYLYPESERFSRDDLNSLFKDYYGDKHSIGKATISKMDLKKAINNSYMQNSVPFSNNY